MDDRRLPVTALLVCAALLLAAPALAHVERPSYWPDPAPDTSVKPAAGGKVPKVRSLASALDKKLPGETRVVCQPDSLERLKASVTLALEGGYHIRPSDHRSLSKKAGARLIAINTKLFARCKYREIQPAVNASGNNDRVVIMPGLYEEPTSRAQPTHDPKCNDLKTDGDHPGEQGGALTYKGEFTCPNDANLIAVMGREPGPNPPPRPPRWDRHGIPDLGRCIRCNVQMEGSGVSADDVVVEAGDASKGNGGPSGAGHEKDVGIRADRADGFVLRNVTVRHAGEHGIYVLESDGFVLDRFKTFYNGLYGTLVFVEDHGIQQNCEAVGHGDSGIYPGAAVDSGYQRPGGTRFRLNQQVRWCDLHHNMAGYSATNGNAIWVHHNNFYDNALGLTTDTVTGAGHPGYPGDSQLIEDNNFYSNNFNLYAPSSDVKPSFPFPIGTGMWIAGGNHHTIRNNHFWDNWRRGTMIFSVPDALVCGPAADGNEQHGCDATKISTSHYNQTYDNVMDQRPDGKIDRNGIDFWWDNSTGARGNCWFRNKSPLGIRTAPAILPDCADGSDPSLSLGTGDPLQEQELVVCVSAFVSRSYEGNPCAWLQPPPDPGDGDPATGGNQPATPLSNLPIARASGIPRQRSVPLGQTSCRDWNAAQSDTDRALLMARVRAFVGGPINDESAQIGHGPRMPDAQMATLFDNWCGYQYAQSFLLYKLYSFTAGFRL
ncbi:MAG TPA: right-handed parallel beta-helix repeat-containing protein, partial [Thermoleophilaceae bacterium]|nr:right-handed parallel beta-helix repeat-containing protein [Thermoleophilaceae bacterium]